MAEDLKRIRRIANPLLARGRMNEWRRIARGLRTHRSDHLLLAAIIVHVSEQNQ
jgi:hypothetical protein